MSPAGIFIGFRDKEIQENSHKNMIANTYRLLFTTFFTPIRVRRVRRETWQ